MKIKAKKDYSRIDHFLNESLTNTSRSKIEKLIKSNKIKLNNQIINRKNRPVTTGDIVEVESMEKEKEIYLPSQELKKLFEDNHIIIIDKPCGISVHPGAGENQETIMDIFRFYYPMLREIDFTKPM